MRSYKIDNSGTTSLFKNPFLESLTRTHFAFPVILYYVMSISILIYTFINHKLEIISFFYLFPLGFITFTFVEYSIHRWVFHFTPHSEKQKEVKYKIHGVHHQFPKDKDRLVMPPVLSVLIALLFYGLFSWLMGLKILFFFPGFLAGYSTYLIIHYAVHRFHPPNNIFKVLWTHHALHHYKSEDAAFAVSFPFWDYLFKTLPSTKWKKQSTKQ